MTVPTTTVKNSRNEFIVFGLKKMNKYVGRVVQRYAFALPIKRPQNGYSLSTNRHLYEGGILLD